MGRVRKQERTAESDCEIEQLRGNVQWRLVCQWVKAFPKPNWSSFVLLPNCWNSSVWQSAPSVLRVYRRRGVKSASFVSGMPTCHQKSDEGCATPVLQHNEWFFMALLQDLCIKRAYFTQHNTRVGIQRSFCIIQVWTHHLCHMVVALTAVHDAKNSVIKTKFWEFVSLHLRFLWQHRNVIYFYKYLFIFIAP